MAQLYRRGHYHHVSLRITLGLIAFIFSVPILVSATMQPGGGGRLMMGAFMFAVGIFGLTRKERPARRMATKKQI